MPDWKGKTALVTGASSGLGIEFARQLAFRGLNLVLTARSRAPMEQLAAEIKSEFRTAVRIVEHDLSGSNSARELIELLRQQNLQVDLLVNNAGFGYRGNFHDAPDGNTEAMLNVNIQTLVMLSRLLIPEMQRRRFGGVLNVASTAAFQPIPYLSLYSASKSFVLHFTEALWQEYIRRGIRIFCLCPGNTRTGFHASAGIGKNRIFLSADAASVVRFGLNQFFNGNSPSAIYGMANRLLAQGYRLLPRSWVVRIAGAVYRPEKKS